MALVTPMDWLPVLAERMDFRQSELKTLRSYVNGNAPLPEMSANARATWVAFQKRARTNFGGIACQSHSNRIRVRGVRVGSDDQSPASVAARRIARDNRLPMLISDAVWDMVSARNGYLVAGRKADGRALLTAEKPEHLYAEPDPVQEWRARAAIKVWRDTVEGIDYANVWAEGHRQTFYRESWQLFNGDRSVRLVNAGGWLPLAAAETYVGPPPVWIFERRDGQGLIEPHLDVIDRINLGKLQRLSTAAIQAFKQRALQKDPGARLPEKDENGNVIDWAKVFEPAPGALWDLPPGINIWESGVTDTRMMLDGEKADARDFGAVTGTPISMLQPDSANQSAGGAAATTAQQVDACEADIDRIKLAAAAAMVTALGVEGVEIGDETVEIDFENPAWVTLAEKMDAYSKAVASGMSVQMAQKVYLGWSQDQIEEDDRNRARASARNAFAALAGSASSGNPG